MNKPTRLRTVLATSTVLVSGLLFVAAPALAQSSLPNGASAIGSNGVGPSINTAGPAGSETMTIGLQDNRTVINWARGFNIGPTNTVDFKDARAGGLSGRTDNIAVLNRDMSGTFSEIYGTLHSDPNVAVFVINTSGIVLGKFSGAQTTAINTGAFFASTSDITNTNFFGGGTELKFDSPSTYSNQGAFNVGQVSITTPADNGGTGGRIGDVVMIGHRLALGGGASPTTISAGGDVALIAGRNVTIQNAPGSPLSMIVYEGSSTSNVFSVRADVSGKNVTLAAFTNGSSFDQLGFTGSIIATGAMVTDRGVVLVMNKSADGVTVSSAPSSITGAPIDTNGNIAISSNAPATAAISSASNVVVAANLISIGSNIVAARNGLFTGSGTLELGSAATITAGNLSLDTAGWTIDGALKSTVGDVVFRTGSGGRISGTVSAARDIIASALASPQGFATWNAGRDISLSIAGSGAATFYSATAGRNVTISANVVQGATVATTTGFVDITSGQSLSLGAITAGTDVRVNSMTSPSGTMALTNVVGRTITINNANYGSVSLLNATATAGDLSITGAGSVFLAADSFASGQSGNVTATGNIVMSAGTATFKGNVSAGGSLTVDSGDITLGNPNSTASSIRAGGALTMNAAGGSLSTWGGLTLQGNSDGIGNEAITLSAKNNISFNPSSTILGGTARQSDVQLRFGTPDAIYLGNVQARGILGAKGSDPFANGIATTGEIYIGNADLVNSLILSGARVSVSNANISNGNLSINATGNASLGISATVGVVTANNITVNASGSGSTATVRGNVTANGFLSVTANSTVTLGNVDNATSLIKAAGSVSITSTNGEIDGVGALTLQSNGAGIDLGTQALSPAPLTLSAAGQVNFAATTTLLGGTNRQSDLQIRLLNPTTVSLGNIQARGLLGAIGNNAGFTTGITQTGSFGPFALRGAITLTNSLRLSGSEIVIAAPITVTGGDIDLSAMTTTVVASALKAQGDVTVRSTLGDLFIASTGSLTGANVVLSTPSAFINNAGSGAITSSHWVVYSASPSGDTFGGLDSGNTALWNATIATLPPIAATGKRYVFALKPTLTFSPQSFSKVYGTDLTGSNSAPFTVTGYRPGVAGAFLGDTAASAYVGSPLISSSGFATRAAVAGGPYALSIAAGTLQSPSGYSFAFNAAGQVTVTRKELVGAVTVNNKTYDGTAIGSGSVALNGVVAGDTVGSAGTSFTFADKNAGAGKTVTIGGTTLTGADSGNYTLTIPATALADILKAVLTGNVTVNNRTYDGTTAATGSVGLTGVFAGDDVGATGTSFAFADKNAGTGKVVNITGTTLTGADGGNYTLSIPATAFADILKAALTGTITVNNKTYDGTTAATGSLSIAGVIAGDQVGTTGSTFAFTDKNAGTGKTVTLAGTTLTGADAGNYTISIPPTALADILKAALTGTVTVNNKTYDGTTTGSGSIVLNGVVAGDAVGTGGTAFTFSDKNAGAGKTVTISGTSLTGTDAGNYTLSIPASALADILKAVLTGTATVNNRTYNGTTAATGSVALSGVVAGDNVGTTGTTFAFADKNAATGKTVAVGGTSLTGTDAGNYTLSIPATALADILKAALTGTITVNNKTYDGTTAATGSLNIAGVIAGDQVGTTGSTFAFADKNAGTGKAVTLTGTTLTGTDAGNYTLTIPASALADILKKALTGTATVNNKTYDGTTAGSGSVALNGVIAGDTVGTGGAIFTFSDKNAGTGKAVTVSGTTLTGTDAGNYTLTIPAGALADILKKALTGTITVNGKTYDGTTTGSGSVALSGVVAGDAVGTSGSVFTFADKNAGTGKTVTVSGTTLNGVDAGNYTLSLSASALGDIARRVIALTADNLSKTQGGSDPSLTYTINSGSLVTGDTFSGALTRALGELPGPYAITQGSLSAGGNYTLNFTPGTLTINLNPVNQQPQTLRALTLPSQIQAQTPSSSNVTLDQKDLCGDDKNCVVK